MEEVKCEASCGDDWQVVGPMPSVFCGGSHPASVAMILDCCSGSTFCTAAFPALYQTRCFPIHTSAPGMPKRLRAITCVAKQPCHLRATPPPPLSRLLRGSGGYMAAPQRQHLPAPPAVLTVAFILLPPPFIPALPLQLWPSTLFGCCGAAPAVAIVFSLCT